MGRASSGAGNICSHLNEGREQVLLQGENSPGRVINKYIDWDVRISFLNLRKSRKVGMARQEEM